MVIVEGGAAPVFASRHFDQTAPSSPDPVLFERLDGLAHPSMSFSGGAKRRPENPV
jgi:hypothetical protein